MPPISVCSVNSKIVLNRHFSKLFLNFEISNFLFIRLTDVKLYGIFIKDLSAYSLNSFYTKSRLSHLSGVPMSYFKYCNPVRIIVLRFIFELAWIGTSLDQFNNLHSFLCTFNSFYDKNDRFLGIHSIFEKDYSRRKWPFWMFLFLQRHRTRKSTSIAKYST